LRWPDAVGGEGELGRERRVAGGRPQGFGDHLVVDGLVTLPDRGRPLIPGHDRCRHGQPGQQGQDREGAASLSAAAARGAVSGAKERLAGGRERGVAGGRVLPASDSRVDGGQPSRPVQVGGVPAVALPCLRVGDDLAVQGAVVLVIAEPVPKLLPGLQQNIVGDLDAILSEDEQAVGAERVDDRVDVSDLLSCRVQIDPAALAPRELAVGGDDGQLGEHQADRVLLRVGQGVIGSLGAAVDHIGYSARPPVGAQGQLAALAEFPGGRHRL
jgi:hypothetical protein